jgi:hypothetical protein
MDMIEETDRRVMLAIMLHGDGVRLDLALMTTARCAVVAFEILQGVGALNARFELLGINAAMPALRQKSVMVRCELKSRSHQSIF